MIKIIQNAHPFANPVAINGRNKGGSHARRPRIQAIPAHDKANVGIACHDAGHSIEKRQRKKQRTHAEVRKDNRLKSSQTVATMLVLSRCCERRRPAG